MSASISYLTEVRLKRSLGLGPARPTPQEQARADVRKRLLYFCTETQISNACADAARFVRLGYLVYDAVERAVSAALSRPPPSPHDPLPPAA